MRDVIGITAKELADATGVRPNYLSMLDVNGPSYATGTAQTLVSEICRRHLGVTDGASALTLQAGLVLATVGAGRTVDDRARVAEVLAPSLKAAVLRRAAEMLCEAHVAAVPHSGTLPRRKRNRAASKAPIARVVRRARLIEPRRMLADLRMREDELIDDNVRRLAKAGTVPEPWRRSLRSCVLRRPSSRRAKRRWQPSGKPRLAGRARAPEAVLSDR